MRIENINLLDAWAQLEEQALKVGSRTSIARKITLNDGNVVYVTIAAADIYSTVDKALDFVARRLL